MAGCTDARVARLLTLLRLRCAGGDLDEAGIEALAAEGAEALVRDCHAAAAELQAEGHAAESLWRVCGEVAEALVAAAMRRANQQLADVEQQFAAELQQRRETEAFLRIERDLTATLGSAGNLEQASDAVLSAGLRIEGIDSAGLYFVDLETGDQHLAATRGVSAKFAAAVAFIPHDSPAAELTRRGYPLYMRTSDLPMPPTVEEGILSMAALPVTDGGVLLAVLMLSSRTLPEIPPAIRPALEGLAARIGAIVAHVRTEAARRASEERFRTVVTASKDAMIVINSAARITMVNAAAEVLFGYEANELLGEPIERLMPAEEAEQHRRFVGEYFRTGVSRGAIGRTLELHAQRRDGTRVPIELTLSAGEHAEEPFVLAVIRDVTARHAAEQGLRASEEQFRVLCTVAPVGIFLADAEVQCLYVNPRLEGIFGRAAGDLLGLGWWASIHPADSAAVHAEIERSRATGEPFGTEYRIVRPDGEERWIVVTTANVYTEQATLRLRVGVVEDSTVRRQVDDADREHREELAHAARITAMGEMASGLAHELAQPLSAILYYARGGGARLARGAWGAEELARTLEKIAAQAERAAEFIRRVKSFVRKSPPMRQPHDLNALVHETLQLMAPKLRSSAARLRLQLGEDLPTVAVDRILIEQVMLNLIRNGLEAMEAVAPEARVLALRTWAAPDGSVNFSVEDTGMGVSEQVAQRMFEPFFSTKPGGTGLGLSISRSIISDLHEGTLWVHPLQPQGASCGFTLKPAEDGHESAG